jgi:hypothetical protein
MNERIKELAEQARVLSGEFHERWKAGPSNEEFFQEKFAKLIVQECVSILETEIELVQGYKSTAFNDLDIRWHEGKIEHFTELIEKCKKHFGVKE